MPSMSHRALKTCRNARRPRLFALERLENRELLTSVVWSTGPSLLDARSGAAAIVADTGSILVVGGITTTGDARSVPALAPSALSWGSVASIDSVRDHPSVGSTGGSKLLIYGGAIGGAATDAALQYDYTGQNSQDAALMNTPRALQASATDGAGLSYAIGGIDETGSRLSTVERYDPSTGNWSLVASLPEARSGASAVSDSAGQILVFGGATDANSSTNTVLRYTVATDSWAVIGSMPTATTEGAAAVGVDGRIYVLGGLDAKGAAQATVQEYYPAANTWTTERSLPSAISDEAAVSDTLGHIVVIGGLNATHQAVNTVTVSQNLIAQIAAPAFTTTAPTTPLSPNTTFTYHAAATGNPQPTFVLVSGPIGMNIDANTGVATWTPGFNFTGSVKVTIRATSVVGSADQAFTMNIPLPVIPTAPSNLTVKFASPMSATLSWSPSIGAAGIVRYQIYLVTVRGHSGRGGGYTTIYTGIGSSATTSFALKGYAAGSHAVFVVAAFDAKGKRSAYSARIGV